MLPVLPNLLPSAQSKLTGTQIIDKLIIAVDFPFDLQKFLLSATLRCFRDWRRQNAWQTFRRRMIPTLDKGADRMG